MWDCYFCGRCLRKVLIVHIIWSGSDISFWRHPWKIHRNFSFPQVTGSFSRGSTAVIVPAIACWTSASVSARLQKYNSSTVASRYSRFASHLPIVSGLSLLTAPTSLGSPEVPILFRKVVIHFPPALHQ